MHLLRYLIIFLKKYCLNKTIFRKYISNLALLDKDNIDKQFEYISVILMYFSKFIIIHS